MNGPKYCYTFENLSSLFPDRSIVREHRPSFEGSFVETCLLLVGKISGVWQRPGGALKAGGHRAPSPAAETTGMLDMLLALAGDHTRRAQVSTREAFRFVCLFACSERGVCKACCCLISPLFVPLYVVWVLSTDCSRPIVFWASDGPCLAAKPACAWFWGAESVDTFCASHGQHQLEPLETDAAGIRRATNRMPFPLRRISRRAAFLRSWYPCFMNWWRPARGHPEQGAQGEARSRGRNPSFRRGGRR